MTPHERYQGLLTVSVLLDDILKTEHTILKRDQILLGEEHQGVWQKKRIAKLELARQALDETRQLTRDALDETRLTVW